MKARRTRSMLRQDLKAAPGFARRRGTGTASVRHLSAPAADPPTVDGNTGCAGRRRQRWPGNTGHLGTAMRRSAHQRDVTQGCIGRRPPFLLAPKGLVSCHARSALRPIVRPLAPAAAITAMHRLATAASRPECARPPGGRALAPAPARLRPAARSPKREAPLCRVTLLGSETTNPTGARCSVAHSARQDSVIADFAKPPLALCGGA